MSNESKPKIVLIDDDKYWAKSAIRELSKIFEVVYLETAKKAMSYLDDRYDIDGVVLDVMMDAPDEMEGETEEGQLTGVSVLRKIAPFVEVTNIPVIVFTNHHDIERIVDLVAAIASIKPHVTVEKKHELSRKELPPVLMARIRAVKGLR